MTSTAIGLILFGSVVQIAGIMYFAVLADRFQTLPLIVAISVGSAMEAAGILMILRQRQ